MLFNLSKFTKSVIAGGGSKLHAQSRDAMILHFAKVAFSQKFCSNQNVLTFPQVVELVG